MSAETTGFVCAHHHLYSALARGMPAPPTTPRRFGEILEQIWWRLDSALDLDMLRASARLGAVEALLAGTTGIVDHHESPNAIEGSLDVIAAACAEVGVRVVCAYGVTDRHGPDGAARGLAENERFLRAGGRGLVGVHAAFTCSDATLDAAAGLAADLGVGVHIHVAEGPEDAAAGERLARPRHGRLAAGPLRRAGPGPVRDDRSQPAQQHEQRRRLRATGEPAEPDRARHRRDRRRHARGDAPRLRGPSRRRRDRQPGDGMVVADQRTPLRPRGSHRSGHVDVRPRRLAVARRRSRRACASPTSSPATARCSWRTVAPPASTSTRCAPTPPNRPPASSLDL